MFFSAMVLFHGLGYTACLSLPGAGAQERTCELRRGALRGGCRAAVLWAGCVARSGGFQEAVGQRRRGEMKMRVFSGKKKKKSGKENKPVKETKKKNLAIGGGGKQPRD